jgi:hypothetical protein
MTKLHKYSITVFKPFISTRLFNVLAREGVLLLNRLPDGCRFDPYVRVGRSLGIRKGCWKNYGWECARALDLLLSGLSIPHVTLAGTPVPIPPAVRRRWQGGVT